MCEQIITKKTGKDFIKEFLIDKIGKLKENEPYVAFLMMSIGIEFLGKCLNNSAVWDTDKMSGSDFNLAITTLTTLRKYQNMDLYDKLRCGLAHCMMVKKGLAIRDKGSNTSVCISCEEFYKDFKAACEEVMNMPKLPVKNLDDTYFMEKIDGVVSTTGLTSSDMSDS